MASCNRWDTIDLGSLIFLMPIPTMSVFFRDLTRRIIRKSRKYSYLMAPIF